MRKILLYLIPPLPSLSERLRLPERHLVQHDRHTQQEHQRGDRGDLSGEHEQQLSGPVPPGQAGDKPHAQRLGSGAPHQSAHTAHRQSQLQHIQVHLPAGTDNKPNGRSAQAILTMRYLLYNLTTVQNVGPRKFVYTFRQRCAQLRAHRERTGASPNARLNIIIPKDTSLVSVYPQPDYPYPNFVGNYNNATAFSWYEGEPLSEVLFLLPSDGVAAAGGDDLLLHPVRQLHSADIPAHDNPREHIPDLRLCQSNRLMVLLVHRYEYRYWTA